MRLRLLVILGVVGLSVWSIYPPAERIKRGIDLNGGVQLVLRVETGNAPGGEPDVTAEQLREETVQQAMDIIERRVNELGVTESTVARYTQADQILVELPGVGDVEGAKRIIRSTSQLRLTVVERGPFPSRDAALDAYNRIPPADVEILPGPSDGQGAPDSAYYAVSRGAAVTGNDVRNARPSRDEFNRPAVAFTLAPEAARRFGAFTGQNVGRLLATVLNDRVVSVATITSRIDADGQIVGFSREEMTAQVINLRSGALPADLVYVEERTIGASLGSASVRAGVLASLGGLALVTLFMVAYYRRAGLNALVSIALNLLILLALVAYIPVTMTLAGIAGLILTIGMGVDSNVLIFERIKEELAAGGTPRAAVTRAFDRVWLTIVDTHVASLIAAAFLFQFGTSPIKGFATTLTLGLAANVFTAVFVSRTLFMLALRWRNGSSALGIQWRMRRVMAAGFDVERWRAPAIALSLVVIMAGAATVATRGLSLGIDFSGGTFVVTEFSEDGVREDAVRTAVATLPGETVVQRYGDSEERRFLLRSPLPPGNGRQQDLERRVHEMTQALEAADLPAFDVVRRDLVSAAIGEDLQRRGLYATLASLAGITLYIGARFRPSFAAGGSAATLHDVLVTLACVALAGYDLSLHVTAALLTITGYSVNDTIVVFDRVRENLRAMPRHPLQHIVNLSVQQTLSRTIITAGTTFLAALALFLFGGAALEGFAFTMMVGIVSGTYSTVFIASAIAMRLSKARHPVVRHSVL